MKEFLPTNLWHISSQEHFLCLPFTPRWSRDLCFWWFEKEDQKRCKSDWHFYHNPFSNAHLIISKSTVVRVIKGKQAFSFKPCIMYALMWWYYRGNSPIFVCENGTNVMVVPRCIFDTFPEATCRLYERETTLLWYISKSVVTHFFEVLDWLILSAKSRRKSLAKPGELSKT